MATNGAERNGKVAQPRLKQRYQTEIVPKLREEFGYPNVMAVPRVEKVVLNIGIGEAIQNTRALDAASKDLAAISGQRPWVRRARKSVAAFKLREGMPVGLMVTLRGDRMYEFLDRFLNLALPRVRDFRGLSTRSFDGRGNYTVGLREQLIFPEIEYDKIDKVRGLEVSIVTSATSDAEARRLLELMGMPFQRADTRETRAAS
jgi:large subunit ribosomal protein L5